MPLALQRVDQRPSRRCVGLAKTGLSRRKENGRPAPEAAGLACASDGGLAVGWGVGVAVVEGRASRRTTGGDGVIRDRRGSPARQRARAQQQTPPSGEAGRLSASSAGKQISSENCQVHTAHPRDGPGRSSRSAFELPAGRPSAALRRMERQPGSAAPRGRNSGVDRLAIAPSLELRNYPPAGQCPVSSENRGPTIETGHPRRELRNGLTGWWGRGAWGKLAPYLPAFGHQ